MSYQKEILKKYRNCFPSDTFVKISERTGIQVTRVFRIFNGYSMKLTEYEVLTQVTQNDSGIDSQARSTFNSCIALLDASNLKSLYFEAEYLLKQAQYKQLIQLPIHQLKEVQSV